MVALQSSAVAHELQDPEQPQKPDGSQGAKVAAGCHVYFVLRSVFVRLSVCLYSVAFTLQVSVKCLSHKLEKNSKPHCS